MEERLTTGTKLQPHSQSPPTKAAVPKDGDLPATLEFTTVSQFILLYNDKGSGAGMDGAFYRPVVPDGFFFMGDYGQGNYSQPYGSVYVVQIVTDSDKSALAVPLDWVEIWNDHHTGAHSDGSFWAPIPPPGYVACGHVVQSGYDKPHPSLSSPYIERFRCVRHDLTRQMQTENLIWKDKGSGVKNDVSVFAVPYTNDFVTTPNYNSSTNIWVPNDLIP